ncbi:MAG: hypothetical protein AB1733_11095 [Thermodesulfobacteriota bacterium]
MSKRTDGPRVLIRVNDKAGNEYLCPVEELRDPKNITQEELRYCFDSTQEAFTDREVMAIIRSEFRKHPKDDD